MLRGRGLARLALVLLAVAAVAVAGPPSTLASARRPPVRHVVPGGVRPFLIFYGGYPDDGSEALARQVADAFAGYPVVVFGDAWTFPDFAAKVQALLPGTRFYGYAFCGENRTFAHIRARLEELHAMHFQGVLLDGIGSGFSATTARIQEIVAYAHSLGLAVLIDSWFPDTLAGVHLTPGVDGYLCENWVYADGAWRTPRGADIYAELDQLKAEGVLIYMVVTMAGPGFTPAEAYEPVAKTIAAIGGQYVSVSGQYYSAQSNAVFPASELVPVIAAAVSHGVSAVSQAPSPRGTAPLP